MSEKREQGNWDIYAVLLAALLILWSYFIFAYLNTPLLMSADAAAEISYRVISYEQKSAFPDAFMSPNEAMASRTFYIFWIFYWLTGSPVLSYQLELVATMLMSLIALYFLAKLVGIRKELRLLALCAYLAFMPPEVAFTLLLPTNAQVGHLLVCIFAFMLRLCLLKEAKTVGDLRKPKIALCIIGLIACALISGYTTQKLIFVLFVPFMLMDLVPFMPFFGRSFRAERTSFQLKAMSFLSLVLVGCSFLANKVMLHFHGDLLNPVNASFSPEYAWLTWNAISKQILAILKAMGLFVEGADLSLFSHSGIVALLTIGLVAAEWICVSFLQKSGSNPGEIKEMTRFWLFSTFGTAATQILTGNELAVPRYYFLTFAFLPLLVVSAIQLNDNRDIRPKEMSPVLALLLAMALIVPLHQFSITDRPGWDPALAEVADYVQKNDYCYISGAFWDVGPIFAFTDGRVDYLHSFGEDQLCTLTPYNWLIDRNAFSQERAGEPNILLLTDEAEMQIIVKNSDVNLLLTQYAEKVYEIDDYNLYALNENPYTLIQKIRT